VRLALSTAHCRHPLDWTGQLVVETWQKLYRLYGALRDAGVADATTHGPAAEPSPGVTAAQRRRILSD
jgi:hypothetical protein